MSSFDHQPIETIRFNERDQRKIIDELRTRKSDDKGLSRAVRVMYNAPCMTVSISNPGGNTVRYSVIPRNLSRRGVAFLHGRFIYPDSKCNIVLPTLDGESMTMEGHIVRCHHLTGTIHEVAAGFDSPIDLTLFVQMTAAELEAHHEEYTNDVANGTIEQGPRKLGNILLIDSYALDLKLFCTLLDRTGFHCHGFANATEAMEAVNTQEIDAAIIDVCREPAYGLQTISGLREQGLKGPILAISADDDEETRDAALQAGAEVFLAKPLEGDIIEEELAKLLCIELVDVIPTDPIISTLSEDESMRPLLREFVNNARELISTLKSAHYAQDLNHLRLICRQLKGAGGGYGFEDVTYSAQSVIDTISTAENDAQVVREAVDNLLDVLRRIRVC